MPDLILGVDGRDKRILLSNGSANEQDIPTGPIRVQLKRIYR